MAQTQGFRYVFGPVLSGRLGRSLGLDLLGERVCSMNCVYCESGALKQLTLARAPYVPAVDLLAELEHWEAERQAAGQPKPEVVTLGGMGEPTLNSELPQIITGVRRLLPGVPVAVLTNASLMTEPQVRAELAQADMILPSLDALDPKAFQAVNRACPGLDPNAIADGILAFRAETTIPSADSQARRTQLFLEVLLVAGVNDGQTNLDLLAAFCNRLQPDRVDVTTLSRPGTEAFAQAVDSETLTLWRARLGQTARTPAIQSAPGLCAQDAGSRLAVPAKSGHEQNGGLQPEELRARLLASLARRPQTGAQLAEALLADQGAVTTALAQLLAAGRISVRQQHGQEYFQARTS